MNEMAKKKESTPGENLSKQIIEQYHPKSVADMQDALKDIFGRLNDCHLRHIHRPLRFTTSTILSSLSYS